MIQTPVSAWDIIIKEGEGRGRLVLDYLASDGVRREDDPEAEVVFIVDKWRSLQLHMNNRVNGGESEHYRSQSVYRRLG